MSNMLEQAIIDAKSLREAALKDAETALLEKGLCLKYQILALLEMCMKKTTTNLRFPKS